MKKHISSAVAVILSVCLAGCGQAGGTAGEAGKTDVKLNSYEAKSAKPVASGMEMEEFAMSDKYRDWRDKYWDKLYASLAVQSEMDDFYSGIMQNILVSDDENTVCSPLNIYMACSMLAEVSDGETRQQVLDVLGVKDTESLRQRIGILWEADNVDTPLIKSNLADSFWLNGAIKYNTSTLKNLSEYYYASSYTGDPASDEMNNALRKWLDDNTGGLLKDYTSDVSLNPETVMALASTLYYKASWADEFYKDATDKQTFHGTKGDTRVDMMHRSDSMSIYDTDKFSCVELNLVDSGAMWVFLPNEGVDVNELPSNKDVLGVIRGNESIKSDYTMVNVSLPRFKVSAKTDLNGTLAAMGIKDAFVPGVADFSPITANPSDAKDLEICLTKAEHAAVVEADEDGVVGAAYTVMMMDARMAMMEEERDFTVDRPYMFVVTGGDNSILFSGVVRNME